MMLARLALDKRTDTVDVWFQNTSAEHDAPQVRYVVICAIPSLRTTPSRSYRSVLVARVYNQPNAIYRLVCMPAS